MRIRKNAGPSRYSAASATDSAMIHGVRSSPGWRSRKRARDAPALEHAERRGFAEIAALLRNRYPK